MDDLPRGAAAAPDRGRHSCLVTRATEPLLTALQDPSSPDVEGFLQVGDEVVSRDDLLARAQRVARGIAGLDIVAVHATPSLATVVAVTAGLLAGVTVLPLPPDSSPTELAHQLDDSGARLVLADVDLALGQVEWVRTDEVAGTGALPARIDPAHTALLLYTSGTTGPPKGVGITRSAIAADLDGLADAWAWSADDLLVQGLPLFHVHGLILGVLGPLRIGSPLRHTVKPTPHGYAEAGGSLYFGVPTVWTRISREPRAAAALRGARLLVSGSAALPAPVAATLQDLAGQSPVERYGMTETLITIATRADGENRRGWVGQPVAGVRTRIVDDTGAPIPADGQTTGSLQVCGDTLFAGYRDSTGRTTPAADCSGWFTTGDIAIADETGYHRIVGRASTDLIKSGGYRIGAGEVEDVLLAHPGVQEAAVIGVPDPDLGEIVTAFVIADVPTDALKDFAAERLSRHKCPRAIHLVDTLPRNAMGKVVKSRLRGQ